MRAIELFAGVGGFRIGLDRANIETVWANEWDKYAAATYRYRFGDINPQRQTFFGCCCIVLRNRIGDYFMENK